MGAPLWSNNAATKLASGLSSGATSLAVMSGAGVLFPTPTGSDYFYVTLVRASDGAIEIVKATARSGDTLTVTRAQQGTAALTLDAGDKVELRITAQWLHDHTTPGGDTALQKADGNGGFADAVAGTDYDAAGAAATVAGNLTTHAGLTGTAAHGLGTASTHAATDFDAAGVATGAVSTHAALQTGVHGISITAGKTLAATNSLTLSGTDAATLNIGAGGTLGTAAYTASTAYLAASATTVNGTPIPASATLLTSGGALGTPASGNLVNCTIPAPTGLSITAGKTLTVSNTLTLSGTDGSTLAIGTGGTLGSAAYTASTDYISSSGGYYPGLTAGSTTSCLINASSGASNYLVCVNAQTGYIGEYSCASAKYNASTGVITASGFVGPVTGSASSVANAITFNNSGAGTTSGIAYNGSFAQTISYNTIGAQPAGSYYSAGGALGTPASGTLTNCTGTASGLTAGVATAGTITAASGAGPFYLTGVTATTGNLGEYSLGSATYNATTGVLTASGFSGPHNGAVGGSTPAAGAFTTLSASSTVSGTGFSTYLASPPAIGGTTPAAGTFTTLAAKSGPNAGLTVASADGTTFKGIVFDTSDNQMTVGTQTNHPLVFYTNNSEKVRIDTPGNLLIAGGGVAKGTANGAINYSGGATTSDGGIVVCYGSSGSTYPGSLVFYTGTTLNTPVLRAVLSGAGNLTLNTPDSGGHTINGAMTVTGALSAVTLNATSDRRKKTNIRKIESALEIVKRLNGVRFDMLDTGLPSAGLIAQDVEGDFPELVTETDGVKSLNYNGVIGLLVECIKDLCALIEE